MPDREPSTLWGRLIALPVDSTPKTIFVAVTLCLFCSMIVAFAAVNLRPIQPVSYTHLTLPTKA